MKEDSLQEDHLQEDPLQKELNNTKNTLNLFHEDRKTESEDIKQKTQSYFSWVSRKTNYIKNENIYVPKKENSIPIIKRGKVFWIHFGFNIGQEFGGHHPGIVLKTGGETAVVVPLSTKDPTSYQKTLVNYVEVSTITNFKVLGYSRWINLLNAMPVSFQRFDENGRVGTVPGPIMKQISINMNKLWRP